jgi:hypothetical protein
MHYFYSESFVNTMTDQVRSTWADLELGQYDLGLKRNVLAELEQEIKKTVEPYISESYLKDKLTVFETSLWDYMLGKRSDIPPLTFHEVKADIVATTEQYLNNFAKDVPIPSKQINNVVNNLSNNINTEVDLLTSIGITEAQLLEVKRIYEDTKQFNGILITLILLLLIVGLTLSYYLTTVFRWLGITMMLIGGLLAATSIALKEPLSQWLSNYVRVDEGGQSLANEMVNAVKQLLTDMLGTIQSTHLVIFILGILIFMLSFLPAIKQVTTKQQEHIRHKAIVTIRTILIVAALFVLGWEGMQTYNIILSLRG